MGLPARRAAPSPVSDTGERGEWSVIAYVDAGVVARYGAREERIYPDMKILQVMMRYPAVARRFHEFLAQLSSRQRLGMMAFLADLSQYLPFIFAAALVPFVKRSEADSLRDCLRHLSDDFYEKNSNFIVTQEYYDRYCRENVNGIRFIEMRIETALSDFRGINPLEIKYEDREDKKQNAPSFLVAHYGYLLLRDEITLTNIRKMDPSLWRGLRNWANHNKQDLELLIPKGRTSPGRPASELPPKILANRKRSLAAQRAKRYRDRKKGLAPS